MDYASEYSEAQLRELTERIREVYKQAAQEIQAKLDAFVEAYERKSREMLKQVAEGKKTMAEYQRWVAGQVFQTEQWKHKLTDITNVYVNADSVARVLINGSNYNVFVEASNFTAYSISQHYGMGVSFDLYDRATVERLLRLDPMMLPEWKIDELKDYIWNEKRVKNAITQGIIQGESIQQIAMRLYGELSASNARKMELFARTAVTGAQNAGRVARMEEAESMGISVRKKWIASLDNRTRDAHQHLDGETAAPDEPFKSDLGDIMYPGDPTATPANVYNCRCTLGYDYPEYSTGGPRRAYNDPDSRESEVVEYQTYEQWKNSRGNNDRFLHTGGHNSRSGATRPAPGWQAAHAVRYYNEVANRKPYVDARKIAPQTPLTEEQIEQIRQHLFIQEHDFGNGEIHRFDPSYEQAEAWQRLADGKGTQTDVLMLMHEYEELTLIRQLGYNQDEAHRLANKKYNWWARRVQELNGKDDHIAEIPQDKH